MGYDTLIRNGVALAKSMTSSLQVTVTVNHWRGQDSYGRPTIVTQTYQALVERNARNIKMRDGQEVTAKSYILFLEPIAATTPLTGQTRENPIDERDQIILPDGQTGPILAVNGFMDGGTGAPYYTEVYLGRSEQAQ
jgi:hypothetical protein